MGEIPRSNTDDYTNEMAQKRQKFLEDKTGQKVVHINNYSFDPDMLPGNIENFTGVFQEELKKLLTWNFQVLKNESAMPS